MLPRIHQGCPPARNRAASAYPEQCRPRPHLNDGTIFSSPCGTHRPRPSRHSYQQRLKLPVITCAATSNSAEAARCAGTTSSSPALAGAIGNRSSHPCSCGAARDRKYTHVSSNHSASSTSREEANSSSSSRRRRSGEAANSSSSSSSVSHTRGSDWSSSRHTVSGHTSNRSSSTSSSSRRDMLVSSAVLSAAALQACTAHPAEALKAVRGEPY